MTHFCLSSLILFLLWKEITYCEYRLVNRGLALNSLILENQTQRQVRYDEGRLTPVVKTLYGVQFTFSTQIICNTPTEPHYLKKLTPFIQSQVVSLSILFEITRIEFWEKYLQRERRFMIKRTFCGIPAVFNISRLSLSLRFERHSFWRQQSSYRRVFPWWHFSRGKGEGGERS